MIDIRYASSDSLNQTSALVRDEILSRGWSATMPYEGSAHMHITRSDGHKIQIFGSAPQTTSYPAAHLVDNKWATYFLLKESNIAPQLETIRVNADEYVDAGAVLLKKFSRLVVKPVDGAHGKGITINVTTADQLKRAVVLAQSHTKLRLGVLIQQQYDYDLIHEIRILCINNAFIGAIYRMPARVFGDGVHTTAELLTLENEKAGRGEPYKAKLARIPLEQAMEYLGEKATIVPAARQEVRVLGIANYGVGGETIDATDDIPQWMIEQSIAVSKLSELAVIGIDYMLRQSPNRDSLVNELDPIIVELNKSPSLGIHDSPTLGTPRHATKAYVDYLASISL